MKPLTAHAVLCDRGRWLGAATGLATDRDGGLTLARVPGPADGRPVDLAPSLPFPREVSGLALGPCETVFIADTMHDRILVVDGLCGSQAWLPANAPAPGAGKVPGTFESPRGLACGGDALMVADTGHARLQSLAFPRLEPHWAPAIALQPTSIAIDGQGRLLVVDAAGPTLRRFLPDGGPDTPFNATLAAQAQLGTPLCVAVGRDDSVLVSDTLHDTVLRFDENGVFMNALSGPAGWLPGILAAAGARIYASNAASGHIEVFDDTGAHHGAVHDWRGPVTAMAVHANGDLFIKPGLDATYYRFRGDAAYLPAGELVAGPFDAGEDQEWERAWADARTPAATAIALDIALKNASAPVPTLGDWHPLPGDDALLAPYGAPPRRFLWLRIRLTSTGIEATPRLAQVRAATAAENYLDHLPATYRRQDGPEGLLARWLQLLRGEFLDVEGRLDDMPRLADPAFAAGSSLAWLAQWLALELPRIADDDERRALIARATALMARRGTVDSIAEYAELHTGIRPAIIEAYAERRVWSLGEGARLDFDTRLPELDPLGMVVPDAETSGDCCPGPIGRVAVGESGPLATHQIGLPLFAPEAYRFCVVVDAYRVRDPSTLAELKRIIDREKPAHTDYRIDVVEPELRVGLQARIGIDAIVGGPAPAWQLDASLLDGAARLHPGDGALRIDDTVLDGTLTLT